MPNWHGILKELLRAADRLRKTERALKRAEMALVECYDGHTRFAVYVMVPKRGNNVAWIIFSHSTLYPDVVRIFKERHPSILGHLFKLSDARVPFSVHGAYLMVDGAASGSGEVKRALRLPPDFVGAQRLMNLTAQEPFTTSARLALHIQ